MGSRVASQQRWYMLVLVVVVVVVASTGSFGSCSSNNHQPIATDRNHSNVNAIIERNGGMMGIRTLQRPESKHPEKRRIPCHEPVQAM